MNKRKTTINSGDINSYSDAGSVRNYNEDRSLTLYHGTCECKLKSIFHAGLNNHSCLTDSLEIAEYCVALWC